MADVFSRVDWALRRDEFGSLEEWPGRGDERLVATRLTSPGVDDPDLMWRLWSLWIDLPPYRGVLDALTVASDAKLVVRYAALDWTPTANVLVDEPSREAARLATWAIELTRTFRFLMGCVDRDELGWFACPFAHTDLRGTPRLGFFNPAGSTALMNRVAPEVIAGWPKADERGLVYAVGQLLFTRVRVTPRTASSPFGEIVLRCLEERPAGRFESLSALREALTIVGGSCDTLLDDERPQIWHHIEAGFGYAMLPNVDRALGHFQTAVDGDPKSLLALEGRDRMIERGGHPTAARARMLRRQARSPTALPDPRRWRVWVETRPVVRTLIDAGRYTEALEQLRETIVGAEHEPEVYTAIARCHLLAREPGIAVDYARRALSCDGRHRDAHEILASALLARHDFDQALDAVHHWLAVVPNDAHATYVGAKILLALGRLAEAIDLCDRTTELAPKHLPAMLLRWQIARSMRRVRTTTGTQVTAPRDLPEHLRDVRELLVSGQTAAAITVLEKPEHAGDLTAQLLRADLLVFTEQLDAALAAYEAIPGVAAALGRATVLVRMGRAPDALALCDELAREQPEASEPHEARALALQALGRTDEADEAFKRALAADAQRTQMRVKLAGRPSGGR